MLFFLVYAKHLFHMNRTFRSLKIFDIQKHCVKHENDCIKRAKKLDHFFWIYQSYMWFHIFLRKSQCIWKKTLAHFLNHRVLRKTFSIFLLAAILFIAFRTTHFLILITEASMHSVCKHGFFFQHYIKISVSKKFEMFLQRTVQNLNKKGSKTCVHMDRSFWSYTWDSTLTTLLPWVLYVY